MEGYIYITAYIGNACKIITHLYNTTVRICIEITKYYNGLLINVPVSVVIERLTLCRQMFGESTDGALFVRPMLGGNIAIYPTREGIADSMPLDLETFFEAVSMNPVMFTNYLNEKPVENGNV